MRPELENISVHVVQHILTFDWCFSSLIPKVQTIQKYTPLYLRDNVFNNKYKEMKCAKSLFIFIVKLSAKNLEFIDPLRPTLMIFKSWMVLFKLIFLLSSSGPGHLKVNSKSLNFNVYHKSLRCAVELL